MAKGLRRKHGRYFLLRLSFFWGHGSFFWLLDVMQKKILLDEACERRKEERKEGRNHRRGNMSVSEEHMLVVRSYFQCHDVSDCPKVQNLTQMRNLLSQRLHWSKAIFQFSHFIFQIKAFFLFFSCQNYSSWYFVIMQCFKRVLGNTGRKKMRLRSNKGPKKKGLKNVGINFHVLDMPPVQVKTPLNWIWSIHRNSGKPSWWEEPSVNQTVIKA